MFDKAAFREAIDSSGKTAKEIAADIGIDESTFYRKINDNGRFTRQEIGKIADIFGMPKTISIFFAEALA